MFRTNLTTDWDMDICRLVFAASGICKTIGSMEPCNTHHKKRDVYFNRSFFEQPTEVFHIALLFVENA